MKVPRRAAPPRRSLLFVPQCLEKMKRRENPLGKRLNTSGMRPPSSSPTWIRSLQLKVTDHLFLLFFFFFTINAFPKGCIDRLLCAIDVEENAKKGRKGKSRKGAEDVQEDEEIAGFRLFAKSDPSKPLRPVANGTKEGSGKESVVAKPQKRKRRFANSGHNFKSVFQC